VRAANREALSIADGRAPKFSTSDASAEQICIQTRQNRKIYEEEFSKLLRPIEDEYGLSEKQLRTIPLK
jgi:hypothetical protein